MNMIRRVVVAFCVVLAASCSANIEESDLCSDAEITLGRTVRSSLVYGGVGVEVYPYYAAQCRRFVFVERNSNSEWEELDQRIDRELEAGAPVVRYEIVVVGRLGVEDDGTLVIADADLKSVGARRDRLH